MFFVEMPHGLLVGHLCLLVMLSWFIGRASPLLLSVGYSFTSLKFCPLKLVLSTNLLTVALECKVFMPAYVLELGVESE